MLVKQLKPEEYTFARKRAELENRDINVPDNQVEEEFKKIIARIGERISKPKVENNFSQVTVVGPSSMKIPCSVCHTEKMAGQPRLGRLITKYGSVEELKNQYKCKNCR